MPNLFTLGSINIDHVYEMPHFVQPGETLGSLHYQRFAGGKGLNQSIAAARAGATVFHVGALNAVDSDLRVALSDSGVDTTWVDEVSQPTGHAMIQTVPSGENAIVLYPGANHALSVQHIEAALAGARAGDYLLLQNETNLIGFAMELAHHKGVKIAFNPAPMETSVKNLPLNCVSLFFLNETEANALAAELSPAAIKRFLATSSVAADAVVTLGGQGAFMVGDSIDKAEGELTVPGQAVEVVDTTGAGDTFIGYFMASLLAGDAPITAMHRANMAGALCVQSPGAAQSIPIKAQVDAALSKSDESVVS